MKPSHYFEAHYNNQFDVYKFDEIPPCGANPEIDTNRGKYYRHRFEYPDAVFYVYCPQKLTGEDEQKLYRDLLEHAPQGE